ncbi:MAG: tetratricopeptide repeat protein, partial [Bacteroidales bacterium]|nr:tetratricopeptide repeat protein [Bacteroidales bacterium]
MKRISLFLIATFLFAGLGLKSQTPEATTVLNYAGLESRLKKSDSDIQNPKKNTKAKTWTSRADLFVSIYNVHNDILAKDMDQTRAKIFMKEPKEVQTSEESGKKVEVFVYERVDLKFVDGALESWTEKNKIHADPLPEAKKAVEEAVKLNTDGKADADIQKSVVNLKMAYQNEGVKNFEDEDFKSAHDNFVTVLNLNKVPQMNDRIDTLLIYYAGRAALEYKDYTEASRLFEEAASHNLQDPYLYVFRKQSLFGLGDTAKGVAVINEGFSKYPEDQAIMIELINYYLEADKAEEALKLIQRAKAGDPENVSYSFTEGTLLDKMGKFEEAEASYKECIDRNPEYYAAHYNLGVLYYNRAVKVYEDASKITDDAEFEKVQ